MIKNTQKHNLETKKLSLERTFDVCVNFLSIYLKFGISIIDCGCGSGNLTIELAKRVSPGMVIGIDIDESSIALAKKISKKQRIDNISFKHGDVYNLFI